VTVKRKCSQCSKMEPKIKDTSLRDTNWMFVNHFGKEWHGRVCPPCVLELKRIKYEAMRSTKAVQEAKQDLIGSSEPIYPPKLRKCRDCGDMTPNYFKCLPCGAGIRYLGKIIDESAWGF